MFLNMRNLCVGSKWKHTETLGEKGAGREFSGGLHSYTCDFCLQIYNFIITLAREFFKLFQTTPNMSNSIQEAWKLQSCETDPSTTNLFEVSSPFLRPQKRNQHYKAALDEVRRLRPRSRSLPRNFMDDGNQRVRSGRGGESGVTNTVARQKEQIQRKCG